ncbi:hypothetical protein AEP_02259 [Curvibacter sp. AEP1-3]|uniref:phenylacetate--CoA ligase family protein n=1 Tax=Curvibacter sp. AEP1-3 TaxID=1844971 RepID=UPI000B565FA9|nr:phenylacetate--CoA ligase family protein [Curvibacter sp. AEP1-3]ARV19186.1 hypothetical protein AEP_02259 [Curvibacter sp. AEP1-3]
MNTFIGAAIQFFTMIRKMREHKRNEHLTKHSLQVLQLKKFRKLVKHAYKYSPYYRELIEKRSINVNTCIPSDFPILTKELVVENFDRISTERSINKKSISDFLANSKNPADLFLGKYYIVHTSGSNGQVAYFPFSRRDWACGFSHISRTRKVPVPFSPTKIACYLAADGHYAGVSWATTGKQFINKMFFNVLTLEINSPLDETIKKLNDFQPELLTGYPSSLAVLAQKQREGILRISPRNVELGGEPSTPEDAENLRAAFRSGIVNYYGSTEFMVMGASPLNTSSIKLYEDDLHFELNDDHSIVTSLFNHTFPLIRYRMGDVLMPENAVEEEHPYQMIRGIIGRSESAPQFINEDGANDFISPHTINEIFVPGVARFQMRVQTSESFSFLVCMEKGLSSTEIANAIDLLKSRIRQILQKKKMSNVYFEIHHVDELLVDPATRKFRLIVNEVNAESQHLQLQAMRA